MTIKVAIINYGIGNIRSLYNSLKKIDVEAEIITDPESIHTFNKVFLPGVGSYKNAIEKIKKLGTRCLQEAMPFLFWITRIYYKTPASGQRRFEKRRMKSKAEESKVDTFPGWQYFRLEMRLFRIKLEKHSNLYF